MSSRSSSTTSRGAGESRLLQEVASCSPAAASAGLVVGLGKRDEFAASALRWRRVAARPAAGARREVTLLALRTSDDRRSTAAARRRRDPRRYRFDRYKRQRGRRQRRRLHLEQLEIVTPDADTGTIVAERSPSVAPTAANRARDLQNLPSNELTPTALAERAPRIAAAHETVEVEVLDREGIAGEGWAGCWPSSKGSHEEPRADRAALRRRRPFARGRRQGGHLRQRRDLDQAGGQHARDEDGHVRAARRSSRRAAIADSACR